MKIMFGSLVCDKVTGFKGIVIFRIEHMHNCVRYGVQPVVNEEGQLPDEKIFDGPNLLVITPSESSAGKTTPNIFTLGVKVRDNLTGLTGIAVLRVKQRHAGDQYGVQPPMDSKGEIPKVQTFDEEDLEQIDPPPKEKKEKEKRLPSGPHDHNNAVTR